MKWKKILQQGGFCNNRTTVDLRQTVLGSLRGFVFVQSNLNSKLLLLLCYFCFNASNMGQNNKQDYVISRAFPQGRCILHCVCINKHSIVHSAIDGFKFCWKWLYLGAKVKERRQSMLNPSFLLHRSTISQPALALRSHRLTNNSASRAVSAEECNCLFNIVAKVQFFIIARLLLPFVGDKTFYLWAPGLQSSVVRESSFQATK